MSSHHARFLVPKRHTEGERVELETSEARHARVRRVGHGENVVLFDGAGWAALAVVESATRRGVTARIVQELPASAGESPLHLTLALALLKADRFEWTIEKAVELGVRAVSPFSSERSLARPSAGRLSRWQAIAESAAKQCGRSVLPRIAAPRSFEEIVTSDDPRILFSERSPEAPIDVRSSFGQKGRLTIIVGPEGGLTDAEVESARAAGAHIAGLGPRILRAETAAISAVTLCQFLWGDLGRESERQGRADSAREPACTGIDRNLV